MAGGRATGVELADGERIAADAVVAAVDAETVHRRLLGRPLRVRERSVSGLALMLGLRGRTEGLAHHAVTFPADYDAEFDDLFRRRRPVRDPAVYVSAPSATDPSEPEAWFVLVNAPAIGDAADWEAEAERLIDRRARPHRGTRAAHARRPGARDGRGRGRDLRRRPARPARHAPSACDDGARDPRPLARRRDGAPGRRAAARRARRRAHGPGARAALIVRAGD